MNFQVRKLSAEYESAKQEMDRIYDDIADGSILRSKGTKASKYSLSLEKRNKFKVNRQ